MGRIGIWELILILGIVLILFGGTRLAGVGKSLGRGIKEFKEELHADDTKPKEAEKDETVAAEVKSEAGAKDEESKKD